MLKAVFFDLDGTLLPLNEKQFVKVYFGSLYLKVKDLGYDKDLLINTIWKGTDLMYKNDGQKTNEEVFWDYFESVYGKERLKDKAYFDDFYTHEFNNVKQVTSPNPLAKPIVDYVNSKDLMAVLSTNPIFPKDGTVTRMGFVGLKEDDFKFITTYENSHYSKPNPKYFIEIMNKLNLKPEEVILFGNNDYEDYYCALQCGIKCFLVGDYLILHEDKIKDCPKIKMEDVIPTIESFLK